MRFVSDWRPLYTAIAMLDELLELGPVPPDIIARLDAWSDDNAEPAFAVELCLNGERYHATDCLLGIVVDLWLYRTLGYSSVTH